MQANVGKINKKIRIAAGLLIIAVGAYFQSWWGALGVIPLGTALINWCPAYVPLGMSTCESKTSEPE